MNTLAGPVISEAADSHSVLRTDESRNSPRRARLTLFVAQDSPHASAQWIDELRRSADCDVKTWQPKSVRDAAAESGASGLSRALRLLDRVLRKTGGDAHAAPAILVVANETGGAVGAQPARRVAPRGGLAPGVKRRVCGLIDREYGKTLLLSDLAAIAKLSEYHFARAFKQSLGVPPHRYLLERRIAAAVDLVRNSDRCLSDIALEVGFSDQSHFTRRFTRQMGDTPRDYRRRHR